MNKKLLKIAIITIIVLIFLLSLLMLCFYNYLNPDLRKLSFLLPTRFYSSIVDIDARVLEDEKICQVRYTWNLDATEEEKAKSVERVRKYFSEYLNNNPNYFLNEDYEIYIIFYYEKGGFGNFDGISFSNYDPIFKKTTGADFNTISLRMHKISCIQFFENIKFLNIIPLEKLDNDFDENIFEKFNGIEYVVFNNLIGNTPQKADINDFELKVSNAILVNSPKCSFYYSTFDKIQDNSQYLRFLSCSFDFKVIGHMDIANPPIVNNNIK